MYIVYVSTQAMGNLSACIICRLHRKPEWDRQVCGAVAQFSPICERVIYICTYV